MPHSQVKSPWRYCLSCCATLACWAVWLALGGLLGAQLYVAAVKEVPVPDFLLRHIESELAAANLEVRFGRARFEPNGRILFEEVRLRSRLFDDPVLTSRLVYIRKSFWSILTERPLPDELRFEGATLQLPAILSPSGATEPLLRDIAATLHYEAGAWQINQLAGYIGPMRVTIHGTIAAARQRGTTTLTLDEINTGYLRLGRQLALLLPRLQALEQPELDGTLATTGPGNASLRLRLTALAVHRPENLPLELGPVTATAEWSWTDRPLRPLRLRATARRLTLADSLVAENLRVQAELLPAPDLSQLRGLQVQAAAEALNVFGETFGQPWLDAEFSPPDHTARATASFCTYGEVLALAPRADLGRRTAELGFRGSIPPALVTGLLTRYGPKLEPYFRFGDPVEVNGTVSLLAGWKFSRLRALVRGGRLDSHGVPVTAARGRIEVDAAGNFLAHDALATLGENYARGSYWMNFASHDYRMLLVGQLRPPEISGWFRGPWWPDFWKNFAFPTAPPRADVDVQGNWINPRRTIYYGSSEVENPVVLGADFERARTRIFLRPHFTHVITATAERAGGAQRAGGWFKRWSDDPRHPKAMEYDLQGNPTPALYARVGGAPVAAALAAWRFAQPPAVHVWGRTEFRDGGPPQHNLRFTASTPAEVRFSEFPFERLAVEGGLSGADLRLDRIDFSLAGGTGSAKAALGGPAGARWVGLDFFLKDADLARTIRGAEALAAARAGAGSGPLADSRFIKRASGGKLELALSAQAPLDHPQDLRGNGNVQITGAELGEINLFGVLSQVLSAFWLKFSTLKLDSARSSFTLGDGRVHFPDVRISGPSAVIDAKGDYLITPKTLDFTARLKPYEETRNPLTLVMGLVINPLTSIFELNLSGPIAKPNWSVSLGSSGAERPIPPAAAPPAVAPTAAPPSPPDQARPQ